MNTFRNKQQVTAFQVTREMTNAAVMDGAPLPNGLVTQCSSWNKNDRKVHYWYGRVTDVEGIDHQVIERQWVVFDGIGYSVMDDIDFKSTYEPAVSTEQRLAMFEQAVQRGSEEWMDAEGLVNAFIAEQVRLNECLRIADSALAQISYTAPMDGDGARLQANIALVAIHQTKNSKDEIPQNLRDLTLESVQAFIEHAEEIESECLYCREACDSHNRWCVISTLRDYAKRISSPATGKPYELDEGSVARNK